MFVRDLAGALIRDGHTIYIYSPVLGLVAEECRAIGATVVDDLRKLIGFPDVIHGHHYQTVIAAALRFPSIPIVYVCHGKFPPQELPIKLPAIKKYTAVSNGTRERISETTGVNISDIAILPNFVDLNRFRNQRTPPDAPKKVLLFGNYWKIQSGEYDAIAEACRRAGIPSIDVRGESEKVSVQPEIELPNYDVVFAVGRSAIEAMAAGSAVVLANLHGIAGLVTPQNFDRLCSMNFGSEATKGNLLTADSVYQNLLMYNRAQAEIVTRRVRSELNLDLTMSRWKEIYRNAIRSQKAKTRVGAHHRALLATHHAVFVSKWRKRESAVAFAASLMLFLVRYVSEFLGK
jgi:hypothetical protein